MWRLKVPARGDKKQVKDQYDTYMLKMLAFDEQALFFRGNPHLWEGNLLRVGNGYRTVDNQTVTQEVADDARARQEALLALIEEIVNDPYVKSRLKPQENKTIEPYVHGEALQSLRMQLLDYANGGDKELVLLKRE